MDICSAVLPCYFTAFEYINIDMEYMCGARLFWASCVPCIISILMEQPSIFETAFKLFMACEYHLLKWKTTSTSYFQWGLTRHFELFEHKRICLLIHTHQLLQNVYDVEFIDKYMWGKIVYPLALLIMISFLSFECWLCVLAK